MSSIYEPREDSELLAECVRKFARGNVLDMGTGSGVQAMTALALPSVLAVLAVDKNPAAVAHVRRTIAQLSEHDQRRIDVRESDMFSTISNQKFDTILCNPPYLPQPDDDADPALYGGTEGWEWSVEFLSQVPNHLLPGGQLLFLFSSLTGREQIDLALHRLGLQHTCIAQTSMFFEQLYVYRITVHS